MARLGPTVDRLRGRMTTFGLRPYEVYLVWTRWSGQERGEGTERILKRVPILPVPKVDELTAISMQFFAGGTLPVGSLRVTEISSSYSQEVLMGRIIPNDPSADRGSIIQGKGPKNATKNSIEGTEVVDPYEFFWEVVEDGRSNNGINPIRSRFRPMSAPARRAAQFDWSIILERVSEDMDRDGQPRTAIQPHVGCVDPDE